jgi:short-subunit dehydrogenase
MDLAGKTVWVTGASSGIGAALARRIAEKGATVVASARRRDRLEELRAACPGAFVHVLPMDLADTGSLPAVARKAQELAGPIDVLVNNAGLGQNSVALDTPTAIVEQIMRTNYLGPVTLAHALLPGMLERGAGQLVTVTSILGKFGIRRRSAYSASKHALHGYFDSLRVELRDLGATGVQVTLLCPGWVRTELEVRALTADGTPRGSETRAGTTGMTADEFARRALVPIRRGKAEACIGGIEVWGVWVKRFVPSLLHLALSREAMD